MPVGSGGELTAWGSGGGKNIYSVRRALHHPHPQAFCTLSSFARIKKPRWQPVELNDRHLRSHGKIGDCEQSMLIFSIPLFLRGLLLSFWCFSILIVHYFQPVCSNLKVIFFVAKITQNAMTNLAPLNRISSLLACPIQNLSWTS